MSTGYLVRISPSVAILRTQSDERLVELARDGSEAAFAAIVERYRRMLLRACGRVLPEARAEDASQQAFIYAWTALQRGDAVIGLRPWLMTIARNTSLNALRVPGYDYDELRESLRGSEAPQNELERRDVVRQTLAGLASLPERQREVLLRSAVEGTSHAEIARDMGLSDGATRQLIMRARTTLRGAATALMPMPLIGWAVSGRGGSGGSASAIQRIGELVTGAGGASPGAWAAKAGVVTILASSVAVAPSVMHRQPARADAADPPAHSSSRAGIGGRERPSSPVATPLQAQGADVAARRGAAAGSANAAKGATDHGRQGQPLQRHPKHSDDPSSDGSSDSSDNGATTTSGVRNDAGDGSDGGGHSSGDSGSSNGSGASDGLGNAASAGPASQLAVPTPTPGPPVDAGTSPGGSSAAAVPG